MLIDLTRCIGCRACQAACKQWKDLPAETTRNTGSYQNPPRLSANTLTLIDFRELEREDGSLTWSFIKQGCMHCEEPGCVSACTVGALVKRPDGPVVYDSYKCIGCRYCMYACPFEVPTFEWDKTLSLVSKCDFCVDRLDAGMEPACATVCPTDAIQFGDRNELLSIAYERIYGTDGRYVQHVYGEHEVGGTSVMYISDIPFEELGFPTLSDESPAHASEEIMHATPTIAVGMALTLSGVYWAVKRRIKLQSEHSDAQQEEMEG